MRIRDGLDYGLEGAAGTCEVPEIIACPQSPPNHPNAPMLFLACCLRCSSSAREERPVSGIAEKKPLMYGTASSLALMVPTLR